MGQRLGIAAALLGDPATVILDEPSTVSTPRVCAGCATFVRGLAAEGRTVLLSSHLMSEMAQTADHLIVLGRGKVIRRRDGRRGHRSRHGSLGAGAHAPPCGDSARPSHPPT